MLGKIRTSNKLSITLKLVDQIWHINETQLAKLYMDYMLQGKSKFRQATFTRSFQQWFIVIVIPGTAEVSCGCSIVFHHLLTCFSDMDTIMGTIISVQTFFHKFLLIWNSNKTHRSQSGFTLKTANTQQIIVNN